MYEREKVSNPSTVGTLDALEPEQLMSAKRKPLPRRILSPMENLTLWVLRLYLFAVMGILLYQVVNH